MESYAKRRFRNINVFLFCVERRNVLVVWIIKSVCVVDQLLKLNFSRFFDLLSSGGVESVRKLCVVSKTFWTMITIITDNSSEY